MHARSTPGRDLCVVSPPGDSIALAVRRVGLREMKFFLSACRECHGFNGRLRGSNAVQIFFSFFLLTFLSLEMV